MNKIYASGRGKSHLPIFVLLIIGFLSIYSCGGGGDGGRGDNPSPRSAGKTILAWDAPMSNADGSPLTDLAGYKIYYGTSSGDYAKVIDAGNFTTYEIEDLEPGTYYFAVTTYDFSENESDYSNEVRKTIQ
jgi:hypothetical protein